MSNFSFYETTLLPSYFHNISNIEQNMEIPSLTYVIFEISTKEKANLVKQNLHTIFTLISNQSPTIHLKESSGKDGKKISIFSVVVYLERKKLSSFLQKLYFCILTLSHDFNGIYHHKTETSVYLKINDLTSSPETESLKDILFIENRDLLNTSSSCNLIFQFSKKSKPTLFLLSSIITFPNNKNFY